VWQLRELSNTLVTYLLTYYVALDVCQDGGDAARTVIRGRRVLPTHSSSIFRHLLEGNSFNVKVKAKTVPFVLNMERLRSARYENIEMRSESVTVRPMRPSVLQQNA